MLPPPPLQKEAGGTGACSIRDHSLQRAGAGGRWPAGGRLRVAALLGWASGWVRSNWNRQPLANKKLPQARAQRTCTRRGQLGFKHRQAVFEDLQVCLPRGRDGGVFEPVLNRRGAAGHDEDHLFGKAFEFFIIHRELRWLPTHTSGIEAFLLKPFNLIGNVKTSTEKKEESIVSFNARGGATRRAACGRPRVHNPRTWS